MTLEESKEVIPMMEAMITQIEEQQNIMAQMLQEIQEKDEKLMCFQEQEERLQQLESELSELLQILPDTEELLIPVSYTHLCDTVWFADSAGSVASVFCMAPLLIISMDTRCV